MKTFAAALIALCIVTVLTITGSIYMQNTMDDLIAEIKNLPGEALGCREDFSSVIALWQDHFFRIALIVPRRDTDAVETHLAETIFHYTAKNTAEYEKSRMHLCAVIERIKNDERFSLEGVL